MSFCQDVPEIQCPHLCIFEKDTRIRMRLANTRKSEQCPLELKENVNSQGRDGKCLHACSEIILGNSYNKPLPGRLTECFTSQPSG
mmetsp:Transcript_146095/g.269582  ORF Transcript_146095/g.269582 Transcript_146095/m.269582 type:complete len:86 (+) Transcript_146095:61-318(+)